MDKDVATSSPKFKNLPEKKPPQQKSMPLMDEVKLMDMVIDPSNEEDSPQKKGNAISKRNSVCTVANQAILP